MQKNCLCLITENDFITLKNLGEKTNICDYKCDYKSYLDTLSQDELNVEYSQNMDILLSLQYTYEYIKSYYYVNIMNYAKYLDKDNLCCQLHKDYDLRNDKDALAHINEELKNIYSYIKIYTDDIKNYIAEYPTHVHINWNDVNNRDETVIEHSLYEDTYKLAYDCAHYYDAFMHLYYFLYNSYVVNKVHLDNSFISEEEKDIINEYPKFLVGRNAKDRFMYFTEDTIFDIYEPTN